jgi:hypothetical protein
VILSRCCRVPGSLAAAQEVGDVEMAMVASVELQWRTMEWVQRMMMAGQSKPRILRKGWGQCDWDSESKDGW